MFEIVVGFFVFNVSDSRSTILTYFQLSVSEMIFVYYFATFFSGLTLNLVPLPVQGFRTTREKCIFRIQLFLKLRHFASFKCRMKNRWRSPILYLPIVFYFKCQLKKCNKKQHRCCAQCSVAKMSIISIYIYNSLSAVRFFRMHFNRIHDASLRAKYFIIENEEQKTT